MAPELCPDTEELTFRGADGEPASVLAGIDSAEVRVGEFLTARQVWLDGREFRQVRVAAGPDRGTGYRLLDNEILAGRRLHEVADSFNYPPGVSRLHGDEANSAEPFALLEPYAGEPLQRVVRRMVDDEQRDFEIGLLTSLCWLDAARVAHRNLTPETVRWAAHARQAQITDFSLCTIFGVPREAVGAPDWVGPEQRSGDKLGGQVGNRDDMHAAARLIYYVRSQGENLSRRSQLDEVGLAYLDPLFGPPGGRPTAAGLLADRFGILSPVPPGPGSGAKLAEGRRAFTVARLDKHPSLRPRPAPPPVPAAAAAAPNQPGATTPGNAAKPETPADRGRNSRWRRGGRS
jgi:serine/threonine protein kinase